MIKNINEDDFTRKFLRQHRGKSTIQLLSEDFDTNQDEIDKNSNDLNQQKNEVIIDKNDEKFQEFTKNITQFVGALKIDDKAQIVYPKDSDVVLNGVITDMNNLKFQFRYNDQSGGLYIWSDSMLLTRETTEKLTKLVTIREQWKDYWANTITQYTQQK